MTSYGKIKSWDGLPKSPGLPGWLHKYNPGVDRKICKWAAVWGCVYPRKQCVVQKYAKEENVKKYGKQFFQKCDIYFMKLFFHFLALW